MEFLAAVLATLACHAPADTSPVGLWESAARSRGGIGHTLELKADGSYVSATTVIVDLVYRLEGATLFVADRREELAAPPDGRPVRFEGDALVQTEANGSEIRKQRIGKAAEGPGTLVGVWRYRHYTGPMAFESFTPAGELLFRLPLAARQGCFTAQSGTIRLDGGEYRTVSLSPQSGRGELELQQEGKPPVRYRRAPSVWYPRDTSAPRSSSGG